MGFSLITSEAENFLIWLPSICNLSFVDFLFILFSLTLSLSTSFPHRFSKTVLSFYLPDPVQGPWWTWGSKIQPRTQHTWVTTHSCRTLLDSQLLWGGNLCNFLKIMVKYTGCNIHHLNHFKCVVKMLSAYTLLCNQSTQLSSCKLILCPH